MFMSIVDLDDLVAAPSVYRNPPQVSSPKVDICLRKTTMRKESVHEELTTAKIVQAGLAERERE